MPNKLPTRYLWLKYSFPSEMETRYPFVKEWEQILKQKKEQDIYDISIYNEHDYGDAYTNLERFYNHVYAGLLITIYATLEYDLCSFFSLNNYNFNHIKCHLKKYDIKIEDIDFYKEVDILRKYCNTYKHSNIKSKKIDYMSLDILLYYKNAYIFFVDLYEKVNKAKTKKKNRI